MTNIHASAAPEVNRGGAANLGLLMCSLMDKTPKHRSSKDKPEKQCSMLLRCFFVVSSVVITDYS